MKALITNLIFFVSVFQVSAQSASEKLNQIVAAEIKFSELSASKGMRKAFLSVSDENTILFRPGPVKALEFFKASGSNSGYLTWQPFFSRIAKSGDWGFTSGPFTYKLTDTSTSAGYGDYFSVWKKEKGGWKLAVDIGVSHKKPVKSPELMLDNPLNEEYVRPRGEARLQQRTDMVLSNDKLFGTVLKADQSLARREFLTENTRLLFPGFEPIIGKAEVTKFWEGQKGKLTSQPIKADRSVSGELAYTYGDAGIQTNGITKKYYYLRIWELQRDFKWLMLAEVIAPGQL